MGLTNIFPVKLLAFNSKAIHDNLNIGFDMFIVNFRYGGMDLNGAARRKNATRETTNTLKAWLYEHRKNPYPTKGEKIMLAIITKMTLTQVSTWFANARRRLKKENKMTWSPRNRCGDDGDDGNSNDKLDEDDEEQKKDKIDENSNDTIKDSMDKCENSKFNLFNTKYSFCFRLTLFLLYGFIFIFTCT